MMAILFEGCTIPNHLHKSGKYVVTEIVNRQPGGTTLKLQGITKPLIFFSDTLKIGDTVFVKVLNVRSEKINVVTKF